MKLSKTILAVLTIGLLSCGVFSQQAQAVAINGTIQLGGSVRLDTNDLATATTVNIWFDDNANAGFSSVENGNTGDFAAILPGTQVTMHQPWVFNPSTPTPGLWSVAGYTFDLLSAIVTEQNSTHLDVDGTGIVHHAGFDDTSMSWSFSTQSAGGNTHLVFSFSANGTTEVPDGGAAVALLGIALTGIEVLRRKLRVG